jgi:hypothetical protein
MMRICFVGHEFHLKSRSHMFFLDTLKQMGDVQEVYYAPDSADGEKPDDLALRIASLDVDQFVFWQTEPVAASLLRYRDVKRMVLVPM